MIDEKKLIEELQKEFPEWKSIPVGNIVKSVVDKVIRIIKKQPKEDEWIPVDERLPRESLDSVIGWDKYRERCVFVQYYGGRWILGNDESVKIIAWRPLPEAYKPKGEQ